jgi:hypothetical protein
LDSVEGALTLDTGLGFFRSLNDFKILHVDLNFPRFSFPRFT